MPGLDPGIRGGRGRVDRRVKPGDDKKGKDAQEHRIALPIETKGGERVRESYVKHLDGPFWVRAGVEYP